MSNVKPVIPREVADAISYVRECGVFDSEIIRNCFAGYTDSTCTHRRRLGRYAYDKPAVLMAAIINGYTIEKSIEETAEYARKAVHGRIRTEYVRRKHNARYSGHIWQSRNEQAYVDGMLFILNEVNVKIEGVNV